MMPAAEPPDQQRAVIVVMMGIGVFRAADLARLSLD